MTEHTIGELRFFSYPLFDRQPEVTNVVTTRVGGESRGALSSLNLSFRSGDAPEIVRRNRSLVCRALGVDPATLTVPGQIHESSVAVVQPADRGRGALGADDAVEGVDALVTNAAELPLMVLIADCVALSFYDPRRRVIGLAHAGWRGTLGRIAQKTVRAMQDAFGSAPAELLAAVSPSIGRGHYEVGEDVFEGFRSEFGRALAAKHIPEDMDGTFYLDLWGLCEDQLLEAGLRAENVSIAEMCTACHKNYFYSHRHEGGKTGRFAGLIMLHASTRRAF